jgi:hypothetical protein
VYWLSALALRRHPDWEPPVITVDEVRAVLETEGWIAHSTDSFEQRYENPIGMPEGLTRHAVIHCSYSYHELTMWVVALNRQGRARPLADPVTFDNAQDLGCHLACLGPKSFEHVISAFAVEVGLPDGEAA